MHILEADLWDLGKHDLAGLVKDKMIGNTAPGIVFDILQGFDIEGYEAHIYYPDWRTPRMHVTYSKHADIGKWHTDGTIFREDEEEYMVTWSSFCGTEFRRRRTKRDREPQYFNGGFKAPTEHLVARRLYLMRSNRFVHRRPPDFNPNASKRYFFRGYLKVPLS